METTATQIPLSLLILGASEPLKDAVAAAIEAMPGRSTSTVTSDLTGGVARRRESQPDAVLVIVDDAGEPASAAERALATIAEISGDAPATPIIALSRDARPESCIRALRVGAAELLALPVVAADLARALGKVAELRQLARAHADTTGEIWTVAAPKEGVGATTLVANLGIELRRAGRDVVLVDFDVRNGELALVLNLTPPYSLADIAASSNRLDPIFVQGTLVRHHTGLYLLAAPPHADATRGMGVDDVAALLSLLRATHEYVIVDAPPPASDLLRVALMQADRVVLPTELTVPCLRAAWRTIELLSTLDCHPRHLDVIATKHCERALEISLAEARSTLKVPLTATLPRDDETAYRALNRGVALADVNAASPLRKAIVALADGFTAGRHEEPRKRGLLGLLF